MCNRTLLASAGVAWDHLYGVRRMFYVATPAESSFSSVQHVPDYVNQSVPYFAVFLVVESIILMCQGRWNRAARVNDALSSLSAGTISLFPLIFVRSIEMSAYIYIHDKYRVTELAWDSPVTWWLTMLGVDLGYYWVHRCAHEVNFMWAAHQVHHSSEDYNLTTALRQSILQRYSSWIFYIPMAFFIPPQMFMVHVQFNLLYQFWIHTECVKRLPAPIEYIMNTASHHRVHHGRNRYCIDCNYAGVLIIWDRMFGTFVPEDDDDEVVYGLVHPLASWSPVYTQLCHWKYMIQTSRKMSGFSNKLSVFLKGPGWSPGKPRMGNITDIPDIHAPQERYNKSVSLIMNMYASVHYLLVLVGQQVVVAHKSEFHTIIVFLAVMYLLWTMTNLGFFFEHKWYAALSELVRCVVYLVLDGWFCSGESCNVSMYIPRTIFLASAVFSLLMIMSQKSSHKQKAQ